MGIIIFFFFLKHTYSFWGKKLVLFEVKTKCLYQLSWKLIAYTVRIVPPCMYLTIGNQYDDLLVITGVCL